MIVYVVSFIIGLFLVWKQAKERLFDEETVFDLVFISTGSAVFGARIMYIVLHWSSFGFSPLQWILIALYPGMSLASALAFFLLSYWYFAKRRKADARWQLFDIMMISAAVFYLLSVALFFFITAVHPLFLWTGGVLIIVSGILFIGRTRLARLPGQIGLLLVTVFSSSYVLIDIALTDTVYYQQSLVEISILAVIATTCGCLLILRSVRSSNSNNRYYEIVYQIIAKIRGIGSEPPETRN